MVKPTRRNRRLSFSAVLKPLSCEVTGRYALRAPVGSIGALCFLFVFIFVFFTLLKIKFYWSTVVYNVVVASAIQQMNHINWYMCERESVSKLICVWLCGPMDIRLPHPWDSPGKNTGVGSHPLLQRIFPTEGLNLGLLHLRPTLYHLSSLPGESMRYLAWWSNALRQKAEWWLPGAEEKGGWGEWLLNGYRVFVLHPEENSGNGWEWWLHSSVNVLNTTELHAWTGYSDKYYEYS